MAPWLYSSHQTELFDDIVLRPGRSVGCVGPLSTPVKTLESHVLSLDLSKLAQFVEHVSGASINELKRIALGGLRWAGLVG